AASRKTLSGIQRHSGIHRSQSFGFARASDACPQNAPRVEAGAGLRAGAGGGPGIHGGRARGRNRESMSIELKNVTKMLGTGAAVSDVSLSVEEGELVALLGPSGGGKTTVLRMIAGLEIPTTGDVFIRGQRVNDLSVQRRNIGFVFQNYALFKNMNVFKNIAF